MFKKSCFRGCCKKQYDKGSQTLLKSASHQLYLIHWSLAKKLCLEKSLLLTCQFLGVLVNTLAADEKYPGLNRDNLEIPIQMQFSQKQKTFSESNPSIPVKEFQLEKVSLINMQNVGTSS